MDSVRDPETRGVFSGHLAIAVLTGVFCGLLDALSLQIPLFTTDRVHFTPLRIWVLSPLLWAVFLSLIAGLAHLLRLRRWTVGLILLCGPGALIAVRLLIATRFIWFGPRLVIPIFLWACVMLPAAWFVNRHETQLMPSRGVRYGAMFIALFLVGSCVAFPLMSRHDSVRSQPPSANAPNVVVVFLDTMRGDAMADAPKLSAFAERGRRYDHAFAPYSWTLPSHLAVMTGYGPQELDIDFDRQTYGGARQTLAEAFRARGYQTAAVFANPYLNPATGMDRGFDTFEFSESDLDLCRTAFGFVVKALPNARVPVCRLKGEQVTERALSLFNGAQRPLFLTLNYFDAHLPYYVPRSYRSAGYEPFQPLVEYAIVDRALRRTTSVPVEIQDHLRENYRLSVRYLDDSLGKLIEGILASPKGRETVIAFVGDHGEQFGEHGLMLHANSVYRQVLHVPLVIVGPGFGQERIAAPASITDLYGTLLEASGVPSRRPLPLLPSDGKQASPVFGLYRAPRSVTGLPKRLALDAWSVVDGGHHLIRYSDGREELYDVVNDREEVRDLRDVPELAPLRARLSRAAAEADAVSPRSNVRERRGNLFSVGYMQ